MQKVIFQDLGLINYAQAWDYQHQLLEEVKGRKLENRMRATQGRQLVPQRHYLLFCEHSPVYTLGKSGSAGHLLLGQRQLKRQGFEFFEINRGGDITYHGPGQIVAYPIFDLDCFFSDVHKYVRFLEEAVIRTIAEYGIKGIRVKGFTGVWLEENQDRPMRKICAIGVHLSRWVTMHGLAFNVSTQLEHFKNIIACGIDDPDKKITSLQHELGGPLDQEAVKMKLKRHFSELFGFEFADL